MSLRGIVAQPPSTAGPETAFSDNPLQYLRWVFARFVQGLFAARERGNYQWRPDDAFTEISIVNDNPVDPGAYGDRPIITFARSEVMLQSLGLDDMVGYDMRTGAKRKGLIVPGTMTLFVCSKNDLESERLAFFVAEHLWILRDVLQKRGFLNVGQNIRIGAPSPPGSIMSTDDSREWYATRVFCPFIFNRTAQTYPLNEQVLQNVHQLLDVSGKQAKPLVVSHPLDARKPVLVYQTRPANPALVLRGPGYKSFRF